MAKKKYSAAEKVAFKHGMAAQYNKAFRGSDIILTCTTRQDNKSATCTITYDGVPSSLSIGKPSGVGSYNLGSDSVDLLYAGKTYTSTISMDNIFHDVGTSYNNFSVTVTGVGSYQYADYTINPRGTGYTFKKRG